MGRFVRRYKRFLADVELGDGTTVVAHCTNTGTLLGCLVPGARVALARAANPARKLPWTWRMIEIDGTWVGVDTSIANALVAEALTGGAVPELGRFDRLVTEVAYGEGQRSRVDLVLSRGGRPSGEKGRLAVIGDRRVYVEVKTTTLVYPRERQRVAAFPDAVTVRGRKHLQDLSGVVQAGHRAAMVFAIQRRDCDVFEPAAHIDPDYARLLAKVRRAGVGVFALAATTGPRGIVLDRRLPVVLPGRR